MLFFVLLFYPIKLKLCHTLLIYFCCDSIFIWWVVCYRIDRFLSFLFFCGIGRFIYLSNLLCQLDVSLFLILNLRALFFSCWSLIRGIELLTSFFGLPSLLIYCLLFGIFAFLKFIWLIVLFWRSAWCGVLVLRMGILFIFIILWVGIWWWCFGLWFGRRWVWVCCRGCARVVRCGSSNWLMDSFYLYIKIWGVVNL